jgi:glucose/arabinose dehydrogenase
VKSLQVPMLAVSFALSGLAHAQPAAAPPPPAAKPSPTAPGPAPATPKPADPKCAGVRPALEAIKTADGLVIGPDGTIYFTQPAGATGFLGRYRPPYKELETNWIDLGGKAFGLALDPKRSILYAGSRDRGKLLAVILAESPAVLEVADVESTIHGLTLGNDGAIYYTDQAGGHVHRVTADGAKSQVTASPIEQPSGLAFGPDGALYVMTQGKARVTRLALANGKETARAPFADVTGGKDAGGIAFDAKGQLYVTAGALFRVSPDGKTVTRLRDAPGGNADFGAGSLGCSDLYTAGNGKGIARFVNDTPGMDVPWHRARVKLKETTPPPAPPPPVPAKLAARAKLELVTDDATEPVGLVAPPGEPVGRLFVVEKAGKIRVLRGKTFAPKPFLDLTGQVALWQRPNSEQGLLGLAFHPRWKKNGKVYVNYTDLKWETRVVEYHVDKADPERLDPATARELLRVHQPYDNHNGGGLAFGRDGKLYVLLGDGGKGGDPHGFAQNPKILLGKMLRLDVDAARPAPELLGRGLRNPWRYSFDRKTGDLYIADVGQNVFEYVHWVPANRLAGPHDFGWNRVEGKHCYQAETCDRTGIEEAVVEYPHTEGCSITGGYVYRGKALPELGGSYFFSDFCTAILRSFRMQAGKVVDQWDWKQALDPESQLAKITTFGEDQDGELYIATHDGPIFKLVRRPKEEKPPAAAAHAGNGP